MRETKNILIADNEQNIRTVLSALLEQEGFKVSAVANGLEAKQVLSHQDFAAVITDLKMPEMDGMALLHWVKQHHPSTPIIMITAFATVDTAIEAMKAGAFDYITKPFDLEEMKMVVSKALRTSDLQEHEVISSIDVKTDLELIGQNPAMREIYQLIKKVANSSSPVLISGETGTGKGLIAQALHHYSLRRGKPFIQVNCAAIPETLIESEFFGYERGAFTGAVTSKPGRFELAHSGTLFLDEIGEISPDIQVKLLRAVQDQVFERVGGVHSTKVEVRLITATNRDLKADIAAGRFREDLYYRLNIVPIHLPALRQRIDDIPLLVNYFVKKLASKLDKPVLRVLPEALALLTRYSWPGNIRELENVLERVIVLSDGEELKPTDLPAEILGEGQENDEVPLSDLKEARRQQGVALERDLIVRALEETQGNVTQAAKRLGISRKSLQLKMQKYSLR